MNKQTLLIHNLTALYEILNELKFLINFNLKKINSNEIKEKKFNSSDLIISNDHNVTEKYLKLHNKPIELMKLIDSNLYLMYLSHLQNLSHLQL